MLRVVKRKQNDIVNVLKILFSCMAAWMFSVAGEHTIFSDYFVNLW